MKRNKTYQAGQKDIKKQTYLLDADGKILGRLAVQAARVLRGKHKPTFTPHVDCGDKVIVINAALVKLSAEKDGSKTYFTHSGYPRGAKILTFAQMIKRDPRKVIRQAVAGMLPKGRLGRAIIKNMTVFNNEKHSYSGELKTL